VYTAQGAEFYIGTHQYDYSIYVNKQLLPIAEMIVGNLVAKFASIEDRQIQLL